MRSNRYQLVRLTHQAWRVILFSYQGDVDIGALSEWAQNDWPLIVRRQSAGELRGIPLGIPLPPSEGKRRISLVMQPADILSMSSLPTLGDVAASAPASWLPFLQALATLATKYDLSARVYGSLAWQHLTGKNYLSSTSDLDVVWSFPTPERLEDFLLDLAHVEADAPVRIDGELLRSNGESVNWRELWSGHRELAIKTSDAVRLQLRTTFIESLS